MKNKFLKILPLVNIITPLILLTILLFSKLSNNTLYLMIFSVLIGWILPYFVLLITGITLLKDVHHKLALIFNIFNILLSIMLLIITIKLYDNHLLIFLIEYIIMAIISIINTIYLKIYLKNHPDLELEQIKKIKKENNGIIV